MPSCAIFGCNNYTRKTKGTDIKYFRFPRDTDMQQKWIRACERKDEFKIKNSYVYSIHFATNDFELPLQQQLCNYTMENTRILKSTAVPVPSTKKRPTGTSNSLDQEIPTDPINLDQSNSLFSCSCSASNGKHKENQENAELRQELEIWKKKCEQLIERNNELEKEIVEIKDKIPDLSTLEQIFFPGADKLDFCYIHQKRKSPVEFKRHSFSNISQEC
ncbi:hypothetical protein ABEB36_009602 [Hypothenemus hampei]|uniref:THAP-type domain-containing protein n=1 Tax=Hypothenemus hampei TaxID=57062 RepID=A0ABD1EKY9_HYPHA